MGGVATGGTNSYDEETIENVVQALGLDVESETMNDWLILCPYHSNTRDPSMTLSKEKGIFYCLNPSCNEAGTLLDLVGHVQNLNPLRALRFIEKNSVDGQAQLAKSISKILDKPKMPTFNQEVLDQMHQNLLDSEVAMEYMYGRGFTDETIDHFKFGYSTKQNMIATPMHDVRGNPVGVIGRTLVDKRFKNSVGLPVRQTLFNMHRARRFGPMVIVNESNFDSARVHQAGYPNVVASLGGNFSDLKLQQLDKYFDTIVIMTDDDKVKFNENCRKCAKERKLMCMGHRPGLELGKFLVEHLPHKRVQWAYTGEDSKRLFAKDAGEMTDLEIKTCIENRINSYQASKLW
jgi:DNA primase